MVIPSRNANRHKQNRSFPQNTPPYYCYGSLFILLGKPAHTPNGENDEI
jgi:hypothetical protein